MEIKTSFYRSILLLGMFILFFTSSYELKGQTKPKVATKIQTDTLNIRYRLYATQNIWNFIKLDTRTGKMWQVQFSMDESSRIVVDLSRDTLAPKDKMVDGRFALFPTQNINTFILLDQIDGRTWQVQWGINMRDRLIIPIE